MTSSARRICALFLAVLGAAFLAGGVATSANAAPGDTSPYPPEVCPTITVSTTTAQIGERIGIGGINFLADHKVTLVLKPVRNASIDHKVDLKSVRTDSEGNFTTTAKLPDGATGTYDITARGGIPDSANGVVCPADPSAQLTIADDNNHRRDDNGPPDTAFTGFNMLWLLLLAAVLIAVGIYATRRGRNNNEIRSIHG